MIVVIVGCTSIFSIFRVNVKRGVSALASKAYT